MFTGIIKKLSQVEKVSRTKNSLFIFISRPNSWSINSGDSISVSGVCSTVKSVNKKIFEIEYMPETIKKTTVGNFKKRTEVNLERGLKLNDLLGGHIVQGHIDCRGKIIEIKKIKKSKVIKVKIPKKFIKFVAPQGSVAVDGISLTVAATGQDWFAVSLVGYTLENTNLGKIKIGTEVNIETDILAKYLYNLIKK